MANELLKPGEVDIAFRYPSGRTLRLARQGKIPFVTLPDGSVRICRAVVERIMQTEREGADHAKD